MMNHRRTTMLLGILLILLFLPSVSIFMSHSTRPDLLSNEEFRITTTAISGIDISNYTVSHVPYTTKSLLGQLGNSSTSFEIPTGWNATQVSARLDGHERTGNVVTNSSSMNAFAPTNLNDSYFLTGQHVSETSDTGFLQYTLSPNLLYPDLWGNASNNQQHVINFDHGFNSTGNTFGIAGDADGWDWSTSIYGPDTGTENCTIYFFDPQGVTGNTPENRTERFGTEYDRYDWEGVQVLINATKTTHNTIIASAAFGIKFYVPFDTTSASIGFDWEAFDPSNASMSLPGTTNYPCYVKARLHNATSSIYLGYLLDYWSDLTNEILYDQRQFQYVPWHADAFYGDYDKDGDGIRNSGRFIQDVSSFIVTEGWYYLDLGIKINFIYLDPYPVRAGWGITAYFNNIHLNLTQSNKSVGYTFNQTIDMGHVPTIKVTSGTAGTLSFLCNASSDVPAIGSLNAWINGKYKVLIPFTSMTESMTLVTVSLDSTFLSSLQQSTIHLAIGMNFTEYADTTSRSHVMITEVKLNFTDLYFYGWRVNETSFAHVNDVISFSNTWQQGTTLRLNLSTFTPDTRINYTVLVRLSRTTNTTNSSYVAFSNHVDWHVTFTTHATNMGAQGFAFLNYSLLIEKPSHWTVTNSSVGLTVLNLGSSALVTNAAEDTSYYIWFYSTYLTELTVTNITLERLSYMVGDVLTMNVSVKNVGNYSVHDVRLSFCLNNEFTILENKTVDLPANTTRHVSFSWTITVSGTHRILIIVDSDHRIPESNESNFFYSSDISITARPGVDPLTIMIIIATIVIAGGIGSSTIIVVLKRRTKKQYEDDLNVKKKGFLEKTSGIGGILDTILNLCELLNARQVVLNTDVYEMLSDIESDLLGKLENANLVDLVSEWLHRIREEPGNAEITTKNKFGIWYALLILLDAIKNVLDNQLLMSQNVFNSYEMKDYKRDFAQYEEKITKANVSYMKRNLNYVLVIHKEGGLSLYSEQVDQNLSMDQHLFSGFITAITSFGTELAQGDAEIQTMEYEGFVIKMKEGKFIMVALVLKNKARPLTKLRLAEFTRRFEALFYDEIEAFNGNLTPFKTKTQSLVREIFMDDKKAFFDQIIDDLDI